MLPFDTYKQSGFSFSISVFGFDIGLLKGMDDWTATLDTKPYFHVFFDYPSVNTPHITLSHVHLCLQTLFKPRLRAVSIFLLSSSSHGKDIANAGARKLGRGKTR